jgi:hypothetical protein
MPRGPLRRLEPMEYSFEHGIDHCGYDGIAPILYVGGRVTEQDFSERDLSQVRGVSISQNGLPKGTSWSDLNLEYLFARLPKIEYLRIHFAGQINLNVLGHQPLIHTLIIDCPKIAKCTLPPLTSVQRAEVRWDDDWTRKLLGPSVTDLTLLRPKSKDLVYLSHLSTLAKLTVHHSRTLASLRGIEELRHLSMVGLHDCPNIASLGVQVSCPGLIELTCGCCKSLEDLTDIKNFGSLHKLCIYGGPQVVSLPTVMRQRGIDLELRATEASWIDT